MQSATATETYGGNPLHREDYRARIRNHLAHCWSCGCSLDSGFKGSQSASLANDICFDCKFGDET